MPATRPIEHIAPALFDQLTDIRAAIMDYQANTARADLLDYARDCAARAYKLAQLLYAGGEDAGSCRAVAEILNWPPKAKAVRP